MKNRDEIGNILDKIKNIHFVGIGGISMSALAEIMLIRGYAVTGSDVEDSPAVKHLRDCGASISVGHSSENVGGAQLVVYTAAVKGDNPELVQAAARGLPAAERSIFMGAIMDRFGCPVTVAGTHGKTTTTSMLSHIMIRAGLDPTVLVGGKLPVIGGTFCIGKSEYMVCEACEYADSFLHFCGQVSVILNIEAEHLDYFGDLSGVIRSFSKFAAGTREGGAIVANADDANVMECVATSGKRVISFGMEKSDADYVARLTSQNKGLCSFDAYERGVLLGRVNMGVAGVHNVMNALAAIAAARSLGVGFDSISEGISGFKGTKRRLEQIGCANGVAVMDDYAHHPTEIRATLAAVRSMGYGRIWCLFQPHTYSRTHAHMTEFAKELSAADAVALLPIYSAARESNVYGVSSDDVAALIPGAASLQSFEQAAAWVAKDAAPGDVVLTMGAGDVYKIGGKILELLG